jgi:hypothetical protein
VLYARGVTRVRTGDGEGGRADLRRALRRDPAAVRIAVVLAQVEVDQGRPADALAVLEEVARHDAAFARDPALLATRRAAELGVIEQARTVEALRSLRRSDDAATRRHLAFALAERRVEGEAAEGLLRTLLDDPDVGVKVSTLRLYMRPWLRRRVEADAVLLRRVTRLLDADAAAPARAAAAALLGRVEGPLATRALHAALVGTRRDAEASVRAAAARALGGRDGPATRAALVGALADEDGGVRRAAIGTLFEFTATTRGFEPDAPPASRDEARARWAASLEDTPAQR